MSEGNAKKERKITEMEKDDEYEMELGQNRENSLEIDKSKKNIYKMYTGREKMSICAFLFLFNLVNYLI